MSGHSMSAWLFGKLPAHGDFVGRGLATERREQLDRWLSAEMSKARATFGNRFESAYDSASPWLLATSDDQGRWQGAALCPSVDSAGRRFPVVVGNEANDAGSAVAIALHCEKALYRALEAQLSADVLHALLADVRLEPIDGPPVEGWWRDGNEWIVADQLTGLTPDGLLTRMLKDFVDG